MYIPFLNLDGRMIDGPECSTLAGAIGYISRVGGLDLAFTISDERLGVPFTFGPAILVFFEHGEDYAEIVRS